MTTFLSRESYTDEETRPRSSAGPLILSATGTFLVALALLGFFYLPGQLERTPLDINETTVLTGTGQVVNPEAEDPTALDDVPVKVFKHDVVDGKSSDGDVVVFDSSVCLVRDLGGIDGCVSSDDPEKRLINVAEEHFATDRVTALPVNKEKYVGKDAVEHEGLVNKFPFHAEKKDYPVWDRVAGTSLNAVYEKTTSIRGLEVYVYHSTVTVGPVEIIPDINGSYYDDTRFYVEPRTGSIINRVTHQERSIGGVQTALVLDVEVSDDDQAQKVRDAKSSIDKLRLATVILPIAGLVVGIPLLLAGIALNRRRTRV